MPSRSLSILAGLVAALFWIGVPAPVHVVVYFTAIDYWTFAADSCVFHTMVHCHSVTARLKRTQRALDRGFLRPRPQPGFSWVATQTEVAPRLRDLARSLEAHRAHEAISGIHCHHASGAALVAKPLMTADDFKQSVLLHKRANAARHQPWADLHDPENAHSGSLSGDPIFDHDPWACYTTSSTRTPSPSPSWSSSDTSGVELLARGSCALSCSARDFTPHSHLEALVETQNCTIAQLVAELDTYKASTYVGSSVSLPAASCGDSDYGDIRECRSRLLTLEQQVAALSTASSSLRSSLQEMKDALKNDFQKLIADFSQTFRDQIEASQRDLFTKMDSIFDQMRSLIRAPPTHTAQSGVPTDSDVPRSVSTSSDDDEHETSCPHIAASSDIYDFFSADEPRESDIKPSHIGASSTSPEVIFDAKVESFLSTYPHVVLDGLSSLAFNQHSATIIGEEADGRWPVLVSFNQRRIRVKSSNLFAYRVIETDICTQCEERINLCCLPACGCCPDAEHIDNDCTFTSSTSH